MTEHLETWLAERQTDSSRTALPSFVEKELRAFLRCGILSEGFTLIHCDVCQEDVPVGYSCKCRGFCPSCGAKRMSETVVHLTENVLPYAPYRQWVVTFPHALRFWMATSRKLTNIVHKIVTRLIMLYYSAVAEELEIKDAIPGGMTFIQRFGNALNLHLHYHIITLDGVYSVAGGTPVFYHIRGPTDEEVGQIVEAIANAVIKKLRDKGYLSKEADEVDLPSCVDKIFQDSSQLTSATFASNTMKIAFGERAGQKVRRIGRGFGYEGELPLVKDSRCSSINGFTIHANRYVGQQEREKLQDLIGYAARSAFSHKRLSLKDPQNPAGDLVYELKTPWADGTSAILLSHAELFEKLVALIPPPYIHQTRYFGIFSSHNKWRRKIVLKPHVKKGFVASQDEQGKSERLSWSRLLRKVFKIDLTICQVCGSKISTVNCTVITSHQQIKAVLSLLAITYHPPPIKPARLTVHAFDFDQRQDEKQDL